MMRSDQMYPDRLHFARLRASWPGWFPGRSETEVREALFGETELLRMWYQSMLELDPPYRRAGGLVSFVAELPCLKLRRGTHGSITGRFDLIVAQQVLNEIAVRPISSNEGRDWPLTALSTVSAWRRSLLHQGGAIVVVDNDNKDRRLRDIEDNLPRRACERGSLRSGVVRCARDLAGWLTGPWGRFVPRSRASTKYLVVYC